MHHVLLDCGDQLDKAVGRVGSTLPSHKDECGGRLVPTPLFILNKERKWSICVFLEPDTAGMACPYGFWPLLPSLCKPKTLWTYSIIPPSHARLLFLRLGFCTLKTDNSRSSWPGPLHFCFLFLTIICGMWTELLTPSKNPTWTLLPATPLSSSSLFNILLFQPFSIFIFHCSFISMFISLSFFFGRPFLKNYIHSLFFEETVNRFSI